MPRRTAVRFTVPILALLLSSLAGCPLPYQFSPSGWPGAASATDPSTPGVTAAPVLRWSETSGAAGTLSDRQTASTSSDTLIELTSETVGAVIYYTTDGTTPDPRGGQTSLYTPGSPISLAIASPTVDNAAASKTVTATAIGPNMKPSLVTSATVSLQYPQAAAPVYSLVTGAVFQTDQVLSLSTATPGASIYYTSVSGNGPAPRPVPGQAGTIEYTGPIALSGPANVTTFAAIAVKSQMIDSTTASASYSVTYQGLSAPVLSPSTGTYQSDQTVAITSNAGSTIWYTLDGTTPTPGVSPSMTSGGTLSLPTYGCGGNVTVKAIATANQMSNSPVSTAVYTFAAADPTPSAGTGTYNNVLSLTLASATPGAVVHYTTDGSTPTGSSQTAQPISVNGSMVIKSIAVKADYLSSAVRSDAYAMAVGPVNFAPVGNTSSGPVTVTLSDITAGAQISYSTDTGATWTSYTGPITLATNGVSTLVMAKATLAGFTPNTPTAETYVVAATPSGFRTGTATSASVAVGWTNLAGVSQYVIQRDTNPAFPSPYYLYAANTSTGISDSGLTPATTYYYRIYAEYGGLASPFSGAVAGVTLDTTGMPLVQAVSAAGKPAPTVLPAGAPGGDYWVGTFPTGWVAGGYTYIIFDPDYQNWGSFAIGAYDTSGALVNQWIIAGNRYITGVTVDGANQNLIIYGQNGPTTVSWASIKM